MKHRSIILFATLLALVSAVPALAKDDWIQVKSKNFTLVGNASEKEIRRVATKLEQFRETFRHVFRKASLSSPVPTTVFVFNSNSAYKPFKPKRPDGKPDDGIAGYFQSGEDVNYITLSTEGEDAQTFGTIFHEYVHSVIDTNFGRSDVPTWFNEGLAEYYQSFKIVEDQKVTLGLPQIGHVMLLKRNKLMPIEDLFRVSNYQLHASGGHSRSIFYAQSWVLVHYLIATGKSDAMNTFLTLTMKGVAQDKAFSEAFKVSYAQMENELRQYVAIGSYEYNELTFRNKQLFDADMKTTPLSDPQADSLLGDLLLHSNRADDAEPYLSRAIAGEPTSVLANTAMGMVKMRQRKWDEAKKFLDVAVTGGPNSHLPYYRYAYLLSREGRDEFGMTTTYTKETAERMRTLLRKAINISPSFTESHELLAFVNIVTNEELDEAVTVLRDALKFQPHNQRYQLRIAEALVRQKKTADALVIAEKLVATASDEALKSRADSILTYARSLTEYEKRRADLEKQRATTTTSMSAEYVTKEHPEAGKLTAEANRMRLSESLRKVGIGETRFTGKIMSISCKTSPVIYTVKGETETITLTSKNFQSLELLVLSGEEKTISVGCDAKLENFNALVTYKKMLASRGEIIAIEFVPEGFQPMTESEIADGRTKIEAMRNSQPPPPRRILTDTDSNSKTPEEREKARRDGIVAQISAAIPLPGTGESRVLGTLEQVECTEKGNFFHIKTSDGTLRLLSESPKIMMFTRDLEGVLFICGMSPVEFPAVVIFNTSADATLKHTGIIREMYFVPKTFTLEPSQ